MRVDRSCSHNAARFAMAAIWALLVAFSGAALGQEQPPLLASMFQDHAVLQRGQPIRVWGRAAPGERVTVSLAGRRISARADADGRWSASLPALRPGGPHTLTARAESGAQQIVSDVLIGDVWLCSGQSNMVLEVRRTLDSRAEIANSANDRLRMLTVPLVHSAAPREEFGAPVQWQVAGPDTISEWSGTCYYFARELQRVVDVPMGMVNASWGEANIRALMSAEALRAVGGYDQGLDLLQLVTTDERAAFDRWGAMWESWWREHGRGEPWREPVSAEWRTAPAQLGHWERWGVPELADYGGMVWFRTDFNLTRAQAAQGATLSIGQVDDIDQTWLNGRFLAGTSGAGTQRTYDVPAGRLRPGANSIVINTLDVYATGGMYGPPENRVLRLADGTAIPLRGWRYRIVAETRAEPPRIPWEPTGGLSTIHNGMITPIGPYNFRGVVWYQGESNTGDPVGYRGLLRAFMADWRSKYGADTPFLIVQLAGYGPARSAPTESGMAGVRESQRLAVNEDGNAALAVTIDLGERTDIHPANKQDIGRRLARAARNLIYGEDITRSGPAPASAWREGAEIVVRFNDVVDRLVAYGAVRPIGFELCGAESGSCRFVDARITGTDSVALAIPQGLNPSRVRLCWADSPICSLYDGANLPAGPFEMAITP